MKKLFTGLIFIIIVSLVSFSNNASANEINDIDIHVDIEKDGTVTVTEKRQQDMDEGTENYMVFDDEDLGTTEILDFSVAGFDKVDSWDSDADLEEKAGKYGILDTDDGKELVWGIGDYGEQEYEVTYTLSNLVHNMSDGQSLYWDFNTFSDLPTDNMTMTVSTYEPLTKDIVKFWGFGTEGNLDLKDGNLVWTSDKALDSSNYATLLLQFDSDMYNVQTNEDKTLKEQREMALHNSNYEDEYLKNANSTDGPKSSKGARIFGIVAGIIGGLLSLLVGVWAIIGLYTSSRKKKENGHIESAAKLKKRNQYKTKDTLPDVQDFAGIAFLLSHLNMAYFEEYLEAYLIKWDKEDRIKIEYEDDSKKLSKRDTRIHINDHKTQIEEYGVYFDDAVEQVKNDTYNGDYELLLWIMFVEAMDENGNITNQTLKKWFKKNAKQVSKIADYLEDYSKQYLEENDLINYKTERAAFFPITIKSPTEKGNALIDHLLQYKNYLERELEEEWLKRIEDNAFTTEEMIWTTLLGQSDNIEKRLTKYKLNRSDSFDATYNYPMHFYLTRNTTTSINSGLSSGGFSSSAASGSGGATGVGGGAGAGGGGGGGAR